MRVMIMNRMSMSSEQAAGSEERVVGLCSCGLLISLHFTRWLLFVCFLVHHI